MPEPTTILRRLTITGVHLVDVGDNPGAKVALVKRRPAPVEKAMPKTLEEVLAALPEDQRAVVEAALMAAKQPAAQPEMVEDACKPDEMKGEGVTKMAAELESLRKRVRELEDEAILEQIRKRVAGELSSLPGKADDVVAMLKSAWSSMPRPAYDSLLATLKAAAQVCAKSGPFAEVGSAGSADQGASERVARLAAEVRKSDPKLSMAQARARVYEQHPDLYRAVRGGSEG